jgi:hypothetical protein
MPVTDSKQPALCVLVRVGREEGRHAHSILKITPPLPSLSHSVPTRRGPLLLHTPELFVSGHTHSDGLV